MDCQQLQNIRNTIENFKDKNHHLEILWKIQKNNVLYTENRNGCFINLTLLDPKIIQEIVNYINFVKEQNKKLKITEKLKESYKLQYFEKDNKACTRSICNSNATWFR